MEFIRDIWYAAGWSDEISRALLPRTLLNERILFYRKEDGSPCAISDRCPHRFLPLSRGKLIGDNVECAYHGLRFNCAGECVLNPHGAGVIPSAAKVRTYPLTEQYRMVWIWMGNPEKADPALVPDYHWLTDDRYREVHGTIHMKANYLLLMDNLTDLTHAPFIHENTLGSTGAARAKLVVTEENEEVWTKQLVTGHPAPIAHRMAMGGSASNIDHWIEMRFKPPCCMMTFTGGTAPGRPREEGWGTYNPNIITPETDSTTHYFWGAIRDFQLDNDELDGLIRTAVGYAFNQEDLPAIEAQQEVLNGRDLMELHPVLLPNDQGSSRARQIIERRIKAEHASIAEYRAVELAGANDRSTAVG
jgi:vanillate O-demethylase monooxygenase subunit